MRRITLDSGTYGDTTASGDVTRLVTSYAFTIDYCFVAYDYRRVFMRSLYTDSWVWRAREYQ